MLAKMAAMTFNARPDGHLKRVPISRTVKLRLESEEYKVLCIEVHLHTRLMINPRNKPYPVRDSG